MCGQSGDVPGRPFADDPPARASTLGTEVDHPVGFCRYVEVVLDHEDRVSRFDEAREHVDQFFDVCHMESHSGFVEHVEGLRCGTPHAAGGRMRLGELRHELYALSFPARERGRRLTDREVAEPHVLHELQRVGDRGHGGEEVDRLVDLHREDVADRLTFPRDAERLGVEALSFAGFAGHLDVRQERHFDRAHPLARTVGAGPFGVVEGEAARRITASECFDRARKDLADLIEKTHVGGG